MKVFSYKKYCEWVDTLNRSPAIRETMKKDWACEIKNQPIMEVEKEGEKIYLCENLDGPDYIIDEKWIKEV